jgi:hypothetical protein
MNARFVDQNGNEVDRDEVKPAYFTDDYERMAVPVWALYERVDGDAKSGLRYRVIALADVDAVAESYAQGEPLDHLNVVRVQEAA